MAKVYVIAKQKIILSALKGNNSCKTYNYGIKIANVPMVYCVFYRQSNGFYLLKQQWVSYTRAMVLLLQCDIISMFYAVISVKVHGLWVGVYTDTFFFTFPLYVYIYIQLGDSVMVFNATFNDISSWGSVLLVEETGVHRENHRPVASH